MKIISWNVNGMAACRRKGFLKLLSDIKPDVCCCQEIKAKVPLDTPGYIQFWNPAKRPGYAGTLILTKRLPISSTKGIGVDKFDEEGRLIQLEFESFYLVNLYAPNSWGSPERLDYRMEWDAALQKWLSGLDKPAILCGDFNVAHTVLDSYPDNERNDPSLLKFFSSEREGMDHLLAMGFDDAFRLLYPEKEGAYTWWSPMNQNRVRNRGSRLDYFLVSHQLLSWIQNVRHYTYTPGSDHCPISLIIRSTAQRREISADNMAAMWKAVDWTKAHDQLFQMQKALSQAADIRDWEKVKVLQEKIVDSWAAKMLAVRAVASVNSAAGVDGMKFDSDSKKMEVALSLTPREYRPLPYRHKELDIGGRTRVIHIAAARDKAMQVLYAYTLDPVAEVIADRKSFSARKGRSAFDLHAYLYRDLSGTDAPKFIVVANVRAYYGSIIHKILLDITPMDKTILREFLRSGVVRDGELFATNQGISLGTSLSPILGNILLNGLQSYIFDRLYPDGHVGYLDGGLYRFADDILVTVRNYPRAEKILQIIRVFLEERGLRLNEEKSYITNVWDGFDFLSRHYRRERDRLIVEPASGSIKKCERELKALILNHKGPLRNLVASINDKLTGWSSYHRVTDAYMTFRHIDAVVTGLLVERLCRRHPKWHRETILNKYFIRDDRAHIFRLPDDPSCQVIQLAPLSIVRHKPCKLDFNPYLDEDYYQWLQGLHDIRRPAAITRRSGSVKAAGALIAAVICCRIRKWS